MTKSAASGSRPLCRAARPRRRIGLIDSVVCAPRPSRYDCTAAASMPPCSRPPHEKWHSASMCVPTCPPNAIASAAELTRPPDVIAVLLRQAEEIRRVIRVVRHAGVIRLRQVIHARVRQRFVVHFCAAADLRQEVEDHTQNQVHR